jgi:hypothetical protein
MGWAKGYLFRHSPILRKVNPRHIGQKADISATGETARVHRKRKTPDSETGDGQHCFRFGDSQMRSCSQEQVKQEAGKGKVLQDPGNLVGNNRGNANDFPRRERKERPPWIPEASPFSFGSIEIEQTEHGRPEEERTEKTSGDPVQPNGWQLGRGLNR